MVKTTLFAVLLSVLSGCSSNRHLDMPSTGLEKTIMGGNNREIYLVIPFTDERASTKRCGVRKNTYNSITAEIICKTEPGLWLSKLLANELRASGFKVIKNINSVNENTLVLEGTVLKVFVEPIWSWWFGRVEMDLEVNLVATTGSGLKAKRRFFSKGIKKGVVTGRQLSRAFLSAPKMATNNLFEDMMKAIFLLMNTYPQLGINQPS